MIINSRAFFLCIKMDEKLTDRITFGVMYVLGMIVPIYALVDYCITSSQSETKIVDEQVSVLSSILACVCETFNSPPVQAAFVYHI